MIQSDNSGNMVRIHLSRRRRRTGVVALFASLLFILTVSAAAEPYWVFFSAYGGRVPGDVVDPALVMAVESAGYPIRTVSRYFNAVSIEAEHFPDDLAVLDGVEKVAPVTRYVRTDENLPGTPVNYTGSAEKRTADGNLFDYGLTRRQIEALGVPALHNKGMTGKGVTIAVFDAGFTIAGTGCLASLDIAHTKDFVTGSANVSGHNHGAQVLACLAGAQEGTYYGPAFGATFLLARTDIASTETRADEDRWVAAVEWADSLGADIISSSLVYNEFDTVAESYLPSEMDGKTSLVAQAAEIAFSRGILVVNSAGNEGETAWRIITTPADAEHVLAVGAVAIAAEGVSGIASLSSRGPTADGRIKPDVVAPGENVSVPLPGSSTLFVTSRGTSYAAPLVSGLAALLMEAHPEWSAHNVFTAIKETARDMGTIGPDNIYGWGLPQGSAAFDYIPASVENAGKTETSAPAPFAVLGSPYPNPFNAEVAIPYDILHSGGISLDIYTIDGQHVVCLACGDYAPSTHIARWNAAGCASGTYLAVLSTGTASSTRRILYLK